MILNNTPVEDYRDKYGLLVKREDLCCPPPGPPFSKTRGVYAHVKNRPESVIGVLDTYHSQAGHAVAQACSLLGKKCVNYYPVRKADRGKPIQPQQVAANDLGADLVALQAGRSAILYHQAKKSLRETFGENTYMMPNALKLPEMVSETAKETRLTFEENVRFNHWADMPENILIAISSGTIASGVIAGVRRMRQTFPQWRPRFILHMGYSRSHEAVLKYVEKSSGFDYHPIQLIDEGFSYGDTAPDAIEPLWPCNPYYDLKAFQWWVRTGRGIYGEALLWNIG